MNLRTKEVIEAKIPLEATDSWILHMGIPKAEVKVQKLDGKGKIEEKVADYSAFRVADVNSKEQLIKIGEGIFEEIGRQQLEGSLETKEMISLQGNADNPVTFDITKIRNGTPVRIEIDQDDMKEISRQKSTATRVQYLTARGYDRKVAESLAGSMGKFSPVFYTKEVTFSVDHNDGFSMKLSFLNFIRMTEKSLGK
jgi:hypothetical protein